MSTDKYAVERANADGFEVFILQDIKKQTTAKIIPELGNNCYSLTQIIEAKPIDIITPPPDEARRSVFSSPFKKHKILKV